MEQAAFTHRHRFVSGKINNPDEMEAVNVSLNSFTVFISEGDVVLAYHFSTRAGVWSRVALV